MGWFTMKDHMGNIHAELSDKNRCYLCSSSVAITDSFDIKNCKVVTKLAVGEFFISGEQPSTDESAGIVRLSGRTAKTGQVGWITLKGNAGTVFATPSKKHYVVLRDSALEKQFASGSASVRTVTCNEVLEVLEGPKPEKREPT